MGEMLFRQEDDVRAPFFRVFSVLAFSATQRLACSLVMARQVANHGSHRSLLTMYLVCRFLL